MRAGRLDRLVDIQRLTVTQSDSGEAIESWANLATRRAASLTPIQGSERFVDPRFTAAEQSEFRIRYSSDVSGLSPLDRIVYPALAISSPAGIPDERSIFNILSVNEIGRREGLRIVAVHFADAVIVQTIVAAAGHAIGGG